MNTIDTFEGHTQIKEWIKDIEAFENEGRHKKLLHLKRKCTKCYEESILGWPKTYFLCDTFVSCQTTMHSFLILRQNSKENVKHKCLIQFFMNTSKLDDIPPCLTNFSIYPKKHSFLFVMHVLYLFFDSEEYRFLLKEDSCPIHISEFH